MKKIYWLRRIALLLTTFAVGVLVTGPAPIWLKIGFPTARIWWLMLYDEAIYLRSMRGKYKLKRPIRATDRSNTK